MSVNSIVVCILFHPKGSSYLSKDAGIRDATTRKSIVNVRSREYSLLLTDAGIVDEPLMSERKY
jgi:hypothetical protein